MSCCHVACSHINVLLSRCLFSYQCPVVTLPVLISMSCCHVACSHINVLLSRCLFSYQCPVKRYLFSHRYPVVTLPFVATLPFSRFQLSYRCSIAMLPVSVLLPCCLSVFCCQRRPFLWLILLYIIMTLSHVKVLLNFDAILPYVHTPLVVCFYDVLPKRDHVVWHQSVVSQFEHGWYCMILFYIIILALSHNDLLPYFCPQKLLIELLI